ncbi:uncharacterized protein [Amphiura filiformis]|uniref:uncharacterized protein n=1 Tax=Amphiura filiformis TaxID=82378 RepID=UPI003B216E2D
MSMNILLVDIHLNKLVPTAQAQLHTVKYFYLNHCFFFSSKGLPPSLHISLGLWGKFYQNLERDITELGELIADIEPSCSSSAAFDKHIQHKQSVLKEIHRLEEKSEEKYQEATELEYQLITQSLVDGPSPSNQQMAEIECLHKQSNELNKEAEDMRKSNKLQLESNPIIKRLDKKLQSFKVRRQAYYSGAFVGNHVNKCLKVENYRSLLEEVVAATQDLTDNTDLHDMAVRIQMEYLMLFEHFAPCHKAYSTSDQLTPDQIDQLECNITRLVDYYTSRFSSRFTFTPKFHILFQHVIPFIRLTGVGLGRMSEQGGEQLHHIFNILGKGLEGIKNIQDQPPELKHLRAVMEEHLVAVHPSIRPRPTMTNTPEE